MKKKIIQNFALSAILLTALAVPTVMGAMEKTEVDFKGFGEALQNDGGYGLRDEKPVLDGVDDSVTPDYRHLRELEKSNAQILLDIMRNKNTTTKQKMNALDDALKTIDVDAKDNNGGTLLLHSAARNNNIEIVKYLIEHGADFNATANEGTTSLFNAVFANSLEMVEYFVEHGADINVACGRYRDTPLQWAAGNDNLALVKYLVEHGADVYVRSNWTYTARESATKQQVKDYLEFAEDFYAVNNKQMTFDAFAQKHLINTNKVEYDDADELLGQIATVELNDQKFKVIKSYLTYVDQNFETDNKLAIFAEYANKYTVTGNELRVNNVADTYHLLHLGTKAFFDAFVGFAEQHKLLNFGDGAEKEFILFDCATRKGLHRDAWFKECCSLLGKKTDNPFEKTSEFELTFNQALRKLPIEERNQLIKEKNKILQLKKNLETLPTGLKNKNVNNPCPWAAGKFNDLEFKFKN